MRGISAALCALLAAACSSGGGSESNSGETFGLEERIEPQGLDFPTGLPDPGSVGVSRAFPNLTFDRPVFLTAPPDGTDRLFVVEQDGRIRVFDNDDSVTQATLFLDIHTRVRTNGGEEGLLGLAFHPDYATNRTFYVYYSASNPRRSVISRFQVSAGDPNSADPNSEEILLQFNQPFSNHNAGMLAFGPDGMLYIASGDGGSGDDPQNNAQDMSTCLGKILRITPDGGIPADNPFVGQGPNVRGEIWAVGMRNPWRMSFDRETGTLWCGDVGQGDREEVDIIVRGGNYGWRVYEGDRSNINPQNLPPETFIGPVIDYPPSQGRTVIGGYVYRGDDVPSLQGAYVYADYISGRVWALTHDGEQVLSNEQITRLSNPTSFGEDRDGEVFIVCYNGRIHRFEQAGAPPPPAEIPALLSETGLFTSVANLTPAPGLIEYDVNSPLWSDNALKRRWIAVPGNAKITYSENDPWAFPLGTVLVKHFELRLNPQTLRRLETRVLLRTEQGWTGFTYRWNAAQTDADLLEDGASDVFQVEDPDAPGGVRDQTWHYPSRADCMSCHTEAAGFVLGVGTGQLNRDFAYPARNDNQLRSWNHIGLFDRDIGNPDVLVRWANPADAAADVRARARAYLAANCAQCHRPGGPSATNIDLRHHVAIGQTNTILVEPSGGDLGLDDPFRIDPGSKETSVLWERMRRVDEHRMPNLGTILVDVLGVDLIGLWIDQDPR